MTENEFAELAAGHALNALSIEDEHRFRTALAEHPEWELVATDAAATVAELAAGVAEVPPPPALRSALLNQIAVTRQDGAAIEDPVIEGPVVEDPVVESPVVEDPVVESPVVEAPRDVKPRAWRRRLFALAASVVLLVGIGVATTTLVTNMNRPAAVVALEDVRAADDAAQATAELPSGAQATAYWSASLAKAVLVTEGLEELEPGQAYELWLVRGETPISGGVFTTSGDGEATAVVDEPMHDGDVIAVTIEEAGGSPTGLPTTDPIIVIATT